MLLKRVFEIFLGGALLVGDVHAYIPRKTMNQRFLEYYSRHDHASIETVSSTKSFRYYNNKTSKYRVKSLPQVHYDIGEMYSGLLPINESDPHRALFYVFQPKLGKPINEVTIWLNGGPGCSSLIGFLQENGRFTWQPGTYKPVENPYSWVKLTNMLWVEQPIGTGYTRGKATAISEEEIAQDFVGFFKNFQKLFGIKNYHIYVTGESYAGRFVPYISAAMLDEKDKKYYNLKGAMALDPVIGDWTYTQEEVTVVPFVMQYPDLFNFNKSFLAHLEKRYKDCGHEKIVKKYLQFPPPGHQPAKHDSNCFVFYEADGEAYRNNPCHNLYEVNAMCPISDDVLSFPTALFIKTNPTYFNRPDVKEALHVPKHTPWQVCSGPVFVGAEQGKYGPQGEGDISADPIQKVLPQVIEATNRVLVGNGDFDMVIITNGTLLSIQNMTWNGKLGFQERPHKHTVIDLPDKQYGKVLRSQGHGGVTGSQGIMGIHHHERGLMWAETFQTGHFQPQYQPRVGYRYLQWVLGRIEHLS